jgi:hypothetical protein
MRDFFVASILCFAITIPAQAEELDAASAEALKLTRDLIGNPSALNQAIAKDPRAQKVRDQVKAHTGNDPAKEAATYKLAMEAFAKIVREEGGDMDRIQSRLDGYLKDPNSFGAMLSESEKAQIRGLAGTKK